MYWNISRMECKVANSAILTNYVTQIGIYPEWNVKYHQ